jgi:hypothetical protein
LNVSAPIKTEHDMPQLIALSDSRSLGFPWSRRKTDRLRISDPQFPPVVEISGRLYVDADDVATYHEILRERGAGKSGRKPGPVEKSMAAAE